MKKYLIVSLILLLIIVLFAGAMSSRTAARMVSWDIKNLVDTGTNPGAEEIIMLERKVDNSKNYADLLEKLGILTIALTIMFGPSIFFFSIIKNRHEN